MNRLLQRWIAPLAVALLCVPSGLVLGQGNTAQGFKPVAIVSIASIKENLNDVGYVTRVAGMADQGDTARFLAGAMASGIDKERPIGMYFVPRNEEFEGVAFVPFEPNGLSMFLKIHKEKFGEPKDAGDGILQVGKNTTAFIKEQGGWAFAAANKEHLRNLPQDPVALLGDLPKNYNFAGKLIMQNIPEKLRRTGIDEVKLGIERFLDSPAARQGRIDRDQARNLSKIYVTNIEKLINEADELLIGFGIDEAAKRVVLDVGFSGKEGTSLARAMAMQADAKTNFAGFLLPEASVTMTVASKASPEDIAQAGAAVQAVRGQLAKKIDDSPEIPADKREAIKSLLGPLFDVISKTIETGRSDAGFTVILLPKSFSFAAGGAVADGAGVEKVLKSLADLGKDIPNFPRLQLNTGTIGEMKLNRLTAPIPDPDAREVLGDNLEIIIGVAPKSVIVSGGKDAEGLLKRVIERSAQERDKAVTPFQLNVALLPILKFSKSIEENPIVNNLIAALEQTGNDRVTVVNQAGPRSSTTRVEIQEGILRAIGEGVKSAGARFNRGGE